MLVGEKATGDVEADWIARLSARLPKILRSSGSVNFWAGEPRPVGGVVGKDAWFLEFVAKRDQVHSDGALSDFDFQLLRRFDTVAGTKAAADVKAEVWAVHDELRLMGTDAFVGAVTKGRWAETRILSAPVLLADRHYSLNFTAWRTS